MVDVTREVEVEAIVATPNVLSGPDPVDPAGAIDLIDRMAHSEANLKARGTSLLVAEIQTRRIGRRGARVEVLNPETVLRVLTKLNLKPKQP